MRPEARQTYQGMEVDWSVTFTNAQAHRSSRASVYFSSGPHLLSMIVGKVLLSEYPRLKRLQVGAPVQVRGTIRKIDALFIELEIQDLVFTKAAEAAH